jgi:hypothetical protein
MTESTSNKPLFNEPLLRGVVQPDEELVELFNENDWNYISPETFIDIARTVLEGWGRPAIKPVPVDERLPGPSDCDGDGYCWWWDDDDDMWRLSEHRPWLLCWTHWLPCWALPVPQEEGGE